MSAAIKTGPGRVVDELGPPLAAAAAALAVWHLSVALSGTTVFPSPAAVLRGVVELARRGLLVSYTAASLGRVFGGYGLAVLAGIPLGLLMGFLPRVATAANPVIQLLRPISPIAWIPLTIVMLGVGHAATVFLIFLASFFPIVVATMDGVRTLPTVYVRAARNFGLSTSGMLVRVLLPAALPQILAGLRIAFGVAWLVVVAAEMIAVDSGLGYLIIDARNAGKRYDLVVAGMLLIGIIGLALDALFRRIERLGSVRWGFREE